MPQNHWLLLATSVAVAFSTVAPAAKAQFAQGVVSYSAGSTASAGFTDPSSALGSPARFTGGTFPSVVSPFSPPYQPGQIISIGEGGQLTLQLSNFAVAQSGGLPELGVFANAGLGDVSYPNGLAGPPASDFGIFSATIEVSQNGSTWVSLGNTTFDIPMNGYTDLNDPYAATAGSGLSDFQQPFAGSRSSFTGLRYSHASDFDILDLLAGSGGGKWLDISGTGLSQVGFVRFSVADDGNASTSLRFQLDAVSVSHTAFGATVPEPASIAIFMVALIPMFAATRCRLS
jgi:hypothetical protein